MKKYILIILALSISLTFASLGDIDTQFGTNGKIITNINNYDNFARSIATTEDGSTILAGSSESGTISNITVAKYNFNGKLDNFFGTNGIVNINFNKKISINAVTINSNEQIYLVGSIQNGIYIDILVLKLKKSGVVDSSFGTNGYTTIDLQSKDDIALGIKLQTNGKLVIVGKSNNGLDDDAIILKLNTNGLIDSTFANNGVLINALASGLAATNEAYNGVAIQADGKIVACGYTQIGLRNIFLITRILYNGTLDTKFGENLDGIVKQSIGATNDIAYGINIQEDSKIMLNGTSFKGVNSKFVLYRLLNYGRPDPEMNGNGILVSDYGKANSTGRCCYLQNDNSVLIAGENYNNSGIKEFGLARINYDGSFDENFGINGKTTTTFTAFDNSAYAIGYQTSGQIVLGGETFNGTNYDFALTRYNIATKPRIITKYPFEIRSITAFAGGSIISDGAGTINFSGLVWDTLETVDIFTNAGLTNTGSKLGTYFNEMTGLRPGTKYYVRAYATNSQGTGYGLPIGFTTLDGAKLTTNNVVNIKKSTADCGGNILSDGGVPVLKRGIVWDTIAFPTINRKIGITDNGSESGTFTSQLTGLQLKTLYYVRAYATNEIITNYGNQSTFTSPDFAKVTTSEVITINDYTFLTGGNVLSDGGSSVTKRGVVYNTKPNPSFANRIGLIYANSSGLGSYSTTISGFFPDSTYYLKAFAINEAGISYGNEISFKTYGGPEVTTNIITNIDSKIAISGGNISSGGSFEVSQKGVIWSLFPNPSLSTYAGISKDGTGSGTFVSEVKPINSETFYYIRAYSIYNNIYGYGNEYSFWSLSEEPKSYPSEYRISKTADKQLNMNFSTPRSIQDCDGFLITQSINKAPSFIPKDGKGYTKDGVFNSTKVLDVIYNADVTNYVVNDLILDSNYYYNIFPFNYNGINYETMNYKTDGNIPLLFRQMTTDVNNEMNNQLELLINLSNNVLEMKSNMILNNTKISIFNEIGLESLQSNFENEHNIFKINLNSNFSSGVYFIKFETNNQVIFKKFTYLK